MGRVLILRCMVHFGQTDWATSGQEKIAQLLPSDNRPFPQHQHPFNRLSGRTWRNSELIVFQSQFRYNGANSTASLPKNRLYVILENNTPLVQNGHSTFTIRRATP